MAKKTTKPAKKAAKPAAKKAPAKKAAKKPAPKKVAAKKPVKKVVAKKPAAKKPAPKKPAAKKPAPKKIAAKKPAAKKPAPKKVVAKKPVKKVAAKKPAAKKPAPKKVVTKKPAKKVALKKVVAKKPAAKPAKKVVAKKPEPKKPAPKPVAKQIAKPVVSKAKPVAAAPAKQVPVKAEPKKTLKPEKRSYEGSIDPEPNTAPIIIPQATIKVPKGAMQDNENRVRYSDKDLLEFKDIIIKKLDEAHKDYDLLKATISHKDDHGTDDTSPTFKLLEDGSDVLSKEESNALAVRQQKFIQSLENALIRIQNKTYGICRVTGKLISKERLRVVPHATLSIEAKNMQG